ncbi:MAG: disulfide bond formation protein B [Pseudomonadota bacterium]
MARVLSVDRGFVMLAGLGSAALLLAALGFQYLGGLAPCAMCIWQRWPHAVALGAAALGLSVMPRLAAGLGAAAMLTGAGLALYHVGVEQRWWEGPATCSAGDISGLSAEALMAQIMTAPIVRCDEIAWELAGISMAGWNGLASLALAAVWLISLTGSGRVLRGAQASSSASQ